jgi:hypothetical protein
MWLHASPWIRIPAGAAVSALLVAALVLIDRAGVNWQAVAAVASAGAAMAAWKAATATERTSRDAIEALAVATEPELECLDERDGGIRITNVGNWLARDVEVHVTFSGEKTYQDRTAVLLAGKPNRRLADSYGGGWVPHYPDDAIITVPPQAADGSSEAMEQPQAVMIRYWDQQHGRQYQMDTHFHGGPKGRDYRVRVIAGPGLG